MFREPGLGQHSAQTLLREPGFGQPSMRSDQLGPFVCRFVPKMANILAELDPQVCRFGPRVVTFWPTFGQARPQLAGRGKVLADLATSSQIPTNFGKQFPCVPDLCQFWPIGQHLANRSDNLCRNSAMYLPNLSSTWPTSDKNGRRRPALWQLWPNRPSCGLDRP